jgi:hypothetical protein
MAFEMLPIFSNMYSICRDNSDQLKVVPSDKTEDPGKLHGEMDTVFQVK